MTKVIKVTETLDYRGGSFKKEHTFPVTTKGLRQAIELRRKTPQYWPKMEIVND